MSQPVLLLIGSGAYFGNELALRFSREGFFIVVANRSLASAQRVVDAVRVAGGNGFACALDVSWDAVRMNNVFRAIFEQCGEISCVIFNVKDTPKGDGFTLSSFALSRALNVHVCGVLRVLQVITPFVCSGSSFIITGGGYKDVSCSDKCALAVIKGALHSLTLALVEPALARNIFVKTVVIDGVVGRGDIDSVFVADTFLNAYRGSDVVTYCKK